MTDPIRPRLPRRRDALAGLAALPMALALPGVARATTLTGDVPMGDQNAPVTMFEYASLTCPHCAAFHRDTWPALKERYIETGQVQFIMREVYFDQFGLYASMVARCAGRDGYYPMIEQFLLKQDEWTRADDIVEAIRKIGRLNGLSSGELDACLSNRPFAEELVANYQANVQTHGIESTPSFVINGALHRGNMGIEEMAGLIDPLLDA